MGLSMRFTLYKSDVIGVISSTLCLVHCLLSPLIFVTQTHLLVDYEITAAWWGSFDYAFLVISFFAVYRSAQRTTSKFIIPAFWVSWAVLFIAIMNEKLNLFPLPETILYVTTVVLVALHIYNLNYCQCKTDTCCTENQKEIKS